MQYRAYILIFLLSSFFVSCEKDEWIDDTASASSRRTVFVRLGTDNNFRTEAGEKTALRGNVADAIGIYPSEKYNGFQAALDECVTYKACTNGYYSAGTGAMQVIRTFCGLSVYIPQSAYPIANGVYKKLKRAQSGPAGTDAGV